MKFKTIVGYIGLKFANLLPHNNSKFNLGQKKIRAFFGKLFLSKCGKNVDISKNIRVSHHTKLGNNSGIGVGSLFYGHVTIGDNVMIGPQCWIYTQNHETSRTDIPMRLQGPQKERPVVIGDDVWIGGRVTILPGVKIGGGSIIGAGAVVSKDIPEYAVAVGNPAQVVKYRKDKV